MLKGFTFRYFSFTTLNPTKLCPENCREDGRQNRLKIRILKFATTNVRFSFYRIQKLLNFRQIYKGYLAFVKAASSYPKLEAYSKTQLSDPHKFYKQISHVANKL